LLDNASVHMVLINESAFLLLYVTAAADSASRTCNYSYDKQHTYSIVVVCF